MSDLHRCPQCATKRPGGGPETAVMLPLTAGEFPVVEHADETHAVFRPAVEGFGLDYDGQIQRYKRWSETSPCMTQVVARGGGAWETSVVPVGDFLMFMANVPLSRVREDLRPALRAFRRESIAALRDYWTRGIAVNPRGRTAAEVALLENGPTVLRGLAHLSRAHYYDQMTAPQSAGIGRRDLPADLTESEAQRRAREAYRRGYAVLVGPTLRLGPHTRRLGEPGDPL